MKMSMKSNLKLIGKVYNNIKKQAIVKNLISLWTNLKEVTKSDSQMDFGIV